MVLQGACFFSIFARGREMISVGLVSLGSDRASLREFFRIFATGLLSCVRSSLALVEEMGILFLGVTFPTEACLEDA